MSIARALLWSDFGVISFTVHEPPSPPADRLDRAESLVFVKEGFTYAAAAFAPVWLLAKRQWLAFVVYLAVLAAVLFAVAALDGPVYWLSLASGALHMLLGFEADAIQRFTLARRGYRQIGTVAGRSETECERRFLESWLPQQPGLAPHHMRGTSGTLADASMASAADVDQADTPARRGWRSLLGRRR